MEALKHINKRSKDADLLGNLHVMRILDSLHPMVLERTEPKIDKHGCLYTTVYLAQLIHFNNHLPNFKGINNAIGMTKGLKTFKIARVIANIDYNLDKFLSPTGEGLEVGNLLKGFNIQENDLHIPAWNGDASISKTVIQGKLCRKLKDGKLIYRHSILVFGEPENSTIKYTEVIEEVTET